MSSLMGAWLVEVVLITYRAAKRGGQGTLGVPNFPLPSQYASTFIVFGALGLLPESASGFASLAGWGFVIATALNLYSPLPSQGAAAQIAPKGSQTAAGADIGQGVNIASGQ